MYSKYLSKILLILILFVSCSENENLPTIENSSTIIPREKEELNSPVEPINEDSETESVMYYVRAHNYLEQKNYQNSENFFETVIRLEPNFSRAWLGRSTARFYQEKYDDALSDLNHAIELKNDLADAYLLKSIIFLELGQQANAEDQIVYFEGLVSPEWPILIKARIKGERGNIDDAEELFLKSISISSNPMMAYWWRAIFRSNLNQLENSLDDFKEAIFLDPNNPKLYLDRAKVLINNNQDLEEIIIDLEEAEILAKEPRLPAVYKEAKKLLKQVKE
jgi:tetratricopeptide (TPR) repeat protein